MNLYLVNSLKKYFGDPDVMQHLDFKKSECYQFSLDGQQLEFLSPDYACEISPDSASRNVPLSMEHWTNEDSTFDYYQHLFRSSWKIYNQKLFNKLRMGGISVSLLLHYRPNGNQLNTLNALYLNISHVIDEDFQLLGGGMINKTQVFWTHEVNYSENKNDFFLIRNNGLNWMCGYKLSEGFIEDSFYHTLLNEDIAIEITFRRHMQCPHNLRPAVIDAMNAAERDFIRHFKLETKDNTFAIQNMLAEQYQGKVLTLDDIAGASEPKLALKHLE